MYQQHVFSKYIMAASKCTISGSHDGHDQFSNVVAEALCCTLHFRCTRSNSHSHATCTANNHERSSRCWTERPNEGWKQGMVLLRICFWLHTLSLVVHIKSRNARSRYSTHVRRFQKLEQPEQSAHYPRRYVVVPTLRDEQLPNCL